MANHRPKSLSELNNVYDKAMRAEKAIKEGSSLLSTPENETAPQSENIFQQLETKAAEAQKNQVFDPDITNIANDFLKRFAQPEKPKTAPSEIKRPAPTIQSLYHSAAKPKQEEKQDIPLNMGNDFTPEAKAPDVPLHKPAPVIPTASPIKSSPAAPSVQTAQAEPDDAENFQAPAVTAGKSVTAEKFKPAPERTSHTPHTPHTSPSRVRITSTERSELMEEYMRVMSDDDDEPSYKKPKFSFFKKKKKHDEVAETETAADLYDELDEDEDSAEDEVPVVAFDSSNVKYEDEYSSLPASDSEEQIHQEPMSFYDYMEADLDFDSDTEEDAALDISTTTFEKSEPAEDVIYPTEPDMDYPKEPDGEYPTEPPADMDYPKEPDGEYPTEPPADMEYPTEPAEDVVYPTEAEDEVGEPCEPATYPDAPPADMVFEDIFSVSDESKRSHTGGNWTEVFGEDFIKENSQQETPEASEAEDEYDGYSGEADDSENQQQEDETYEEVYDEEDYRPKKGKVFLKVLMVLVIILSLLLTGATAFISQVVDIDSGNLISEKFRVFCADESYPSFEVNAGDLIITENVYAHTDDVYVYVNQSDNSFDFGKVTSSTSTLTGDYLYITQSESGMLLINRDTSMGVVIAKYNNIGSALAVICNYSIFIMSAFIILAAAMVVCIILMSRKNHSHDIQSSGDYDSEDDSDTDNSDGSDSENDSDETDEYYNEYDTDGIEQGLFVSI